MEKDSSSVERENSIFTSNNCKFKEIFKIFQLENLDFCNAYKNIINARLL